jgi:hypothetical protein
MAESKQPSESKSRAKPCACLPRASSADPDNYRTLYFEIAGMTPQAPFPNANSRPAEGKLPRASADQLKFVRQFEAAVNKGNWESVGTAHLNEFLARSGEQPRNGPT